MVMCMQHLTTISIVSDIPEGKGVAPAQMSTIGPYLQGVLMERLDTSYVEFYVRPLWIRHHAASSQYRGNGIGMPT